MEERDGTVVLTFIENFDSAFRSPLITNNAFDNWPQAINYLKIWDLLSHVRWW